MYGISITPNMSIHELWDTPSVPVLVDGCVLHRTVININGAQRHDSSGTIPDR